jgi:hypothetical protein
VVDTTSPNLTSLTFPSIVDLSAGNKAVTFSATATDDATGVSQVVVWFDKNIVSDIGSFSLVGLFGNGDSWSDGVSSETRTFLTANAPGTYTVDHVDVKDLAGNTHTYTPAQLQALGAPTSITVQGSVADTTSPNLTSLTFPSIVDLSAGNKAVTFSATATDDATGVSQVVVWFDKNIVSDIGSFSLVGLFGSGDSWSDGVSSETRTFLTANAPGTYTVDHVDVKDLAGNTHKYTPAQLQALGAPTSITLQDGLTDDYSATTATTGVVSIGGSAIGNIETTGDADWFAVHLIAGTTYRFDLEGSDTGQGTLDSPQLELRGAGGNLLLSDLSSGGFDGPGSGYSSRITYTATVGGTFYLASDPLGNAIGTYKLSATSDAQPVFPDLVASNALLDGATIRYTINNTRTTASAASTAGIYLSTDSTITTSDTLIATHATPALASSGSDLEASALLFPADLTPGTYFVGAIADYNGLVPESNEANNASSGVPIILGNDGPNTLNGTAGNDSILGLAGNDILTAGPGNDSLDGGAGDDTVVFSGNLASYALLDRSDRVLVSGPDGNDTVFSTEHLQFADGTINYNDGDGLFDTIFYDRQNLDVFHAGIDARAHYNTSGFHEGRDPDALFSTNGYLAVYADVRAAGVNPLQHYDTNGWKEGRDPGANFDTEFYLLHAPDVKAAGVDPLTHYLQFGINEGRAASPAVGNTIQQGGFDAEYYLFANPDVAAAHVNPLAHYNSSGHTELRNPNGYFDAAGYLAHNPDVAAAHVDPYQHYETSGWKEGRNPSTIFDTTNYLAANPDVANAHINPLDHFLSNGIHEGRMPLGDGLWT